MSMLGLLVLGYLLGSIPFSYLVARSVSGLDIRTAGTRNVGARNVMCEVGRISGTVAITLDTAKGLAAVRLAQTLAPTDWTIVLCGAAAVVGHIFPIWLRFQG